MRRRACLPERWTDQAFRFALDPTTDQRRLLLRHVGMRRLAFNWAVEQIKDGLNAYHRGEDSERVSLPSLRKQWNSEKRSLCVDSETGHEWWRDISKEAAANGVADAVRAYWDWVSSRNGRRKGRRVGFPRFRRKGRGRESYRVTTGAFGLTDRRHVRLPRIGVVRLQENARRLDRLVGKGLARVKSVTVSVEAGRWFVSLQVEALRPQVNHRPAAPGSVVGVDVGVRRLATVAAPDGTLLERIESPQALNDALGQLRRLNKKLARSQPGSKRRAGLVAEIGRCHAHVAAVRRDAIHKLTTRLAKTHGSIVIEDLNVAGMARQTGPGSRARRRGLADAALGELGRQFAYKCGWYGSELVVADRWFPSSQICSACGHRQRIGRAAVWTCDGCDSIHDRDDNAAVNLARYGERTHAAPQGRPQQSCGCGPPEFSGGERLSVHKTDHTSGPHRPQVSPSRARQTAAMREDGLHAVNPARGAEIAA